jgi:hypothetical protein
MKKYILIAMLLLAGCSEFPTKYEVIESEKVRLLDFIYEPADAAPGDTVTLKAIFAGRDVTVDMIDWSVSYKVAMNVYGFDTSYDAQPLECNPQIESFSDRTSCVKLSFVIPDSIMYQSPMIKNNWTSGMPSEYRELIPEEISMLDRNQILDTLAHLASVIKSADENELKFLEAAFGEDYLRNLAGLLQIFTVKIHLFADVKGSHMIQDDFSVRYNRVFNRLSPKNYRVNSNPVIDSVLVYKVNKKSAIRFNPSDPFEMYRLYAIPSDSETIIPVDRNCTYFLRSFTSKIDTSLTLQDLQSSDEYGFETHRRVYMYQHDTNEKDEISSKDFMNIIGTDVDSLAILIPPLNSNLQKFTLWLRVYDEFYNENFRKDASTLKEFRGRFKFTE